MSDRITEVRIEGLRTLANVGVATRGLTVLVGENATGKSSILEALEILRRAPSQSFYEDLNQVHGGIGALLRRGADHLRLGVRVEGDGDPIDYQFTVGIENGFAAIIEEHLIVPKEGFSEPLHVIKRDRAEALVFNQKTRKLEKVSPRSDGLVLSMFGRVTPQDAFDRLIPLLEGISVHVPFDVTASWASRSAGRPSSLRLPIHVQPAERLLPTGSNLANAYQALRNDFSEKQWAETLSWIRLGLGEGIESVNTRADPGGGSIGLTVKYRGLDAQLPSSVLSDGTLAYLAMVAALRLGARRSILAIDEPEAHLHPLLLARVVQLLERVAEDHPVLVATQSDRLLDALSDPASSVLLCELDAGHQTALARPDRKELAKWMERYAGYGELRAAGHELSVMEPEAQ